MIKLDDWAKGDLWPFPYFRIFVWKWQNGKFQKVEADIAADFDELKFSSRHKENIKDKNDHTEDDIYRDMTPDTGGVCHFEPTSGDTDVIGEYIGRLVGVRTSGTRPWHSKQWFHYFVTEQSRFGRSDI